VEGRIGSPELELQPYANRRARGMLRAFASAIRRWLRRENAAWLISIRVPAVRAKLSDCAGGRVF